MKNLKKIFVAATLCATVAVGYNAYQQATMTEQERLLQANIEALTQKESWEGKSLKVVECTCPTTGKKGDTFRCEEDGELEPCSATQQGSNACYRVGFAGISLC